MVELGFSDNDLDEKFHNMTELAMEDPPIQKVIDNQGTPLREFASHFISCGHVLMQMRWFKGRCSMIMNEPDGYDGWMRNCFRKGIHKGNMETSRAR